jgi:hypothetical protein
MVKGGNEKEKRFRILDPWINSKERRNEMPSKGNTAPAFQDQVHHDAGHRFKTKGLSRPTWNKININDKINVIDGRKQEP